MTSVERALRSLSLLVSRAWLGPVGLTLLLLVNCQPASAQGATAAPAGAAAIDAAQVAALRAELGALKDAVRALEAKLGAVDVLAPPTGDGLADLDQKVRVIDRKLEIDREQAAERAKTAPVVSAGKGGFSLASADGQFQLRIRGYVQSDSRSFPGEGAELPASGAFILRRVRPMVDGTLFKLVDFRIMPDFGGGTTVLQDAYVDLKLSTGFKVRAGKFKSPIGLERLVSGAEMPFIERALPTAIAPNRDVGVMAFGDVLANRLSWAAGVSNGVPDGASADTDVREGKDVVARLYTHPFRSKGHDRLQNLGFGLAGTFGTERGLVVSPGLPTYRTPGQVPFARYRLDAASLANSTLADGDRWRISPQGYYYTGPFGVLGEYIVSSQQVRRGTSAARLETNAWQLALTYVLTGEDSTYRGVAPRAVFDPSKGTWGAFELTGRVHGLSLDDDAFPTYANASVSARDARAWGIGTNWYLNRALKITLAYDETHFDGGSPNGDRKPEHAVLTRFQVAY